MKILKKIKRKILFIIYNIKFAVWKIKNPKINFHEFYVESVMNTIKNNTYHPSLGSRIKDKDKSNIKASGKVELLTKYGMKPESKVVDFGCGSLRLGKVLIKYLNKKNYFGVDITDKFYNIALKDFDKNIINEKKPYFSIITNEAIEYLSKQNIDYLISSATLFHVPKSELTEYFSNIIKIINKNTVSIIDYICSTKIKRIGPMTWAYPDDLLLKIINNFNIKVEIIKAEGQLKKIHPNGYNLLRIYGKDQKIH